MYRVCPSDFDGNYMYYYPSLYPLANPQLNGYTANNILVYKDNILVSEGKRTANRLGKVWRIPATDLTSFVRSDMRNCGPKVPATVNIELPTSAVFTPSAVRFGADTYSFSTSEPCFKIGNTCNTNFEVTRVGTGQIDQHYNIKILDIDRDTPSINLDDPQNPQGVAWGGRLIFKEPVPNSTVSSLAAQIRNAYPSQNLNTLQTFLGSDNCEIVTDPFEATKLCFNTTYTMNNPLERPNQPLTEHLFQSVDAPVSGIFVEGNVGATGKVKDFRIQNNSLAVGGTVTVRGGTSKSNYLTGQSLIDWSKVSSKLTTLFNSGSLSAMVVVSPSLNGNSYSGTSWKLNSSTSDPLASTSTTYSTPPEGKLWRHDGNLVFTGPVTFSGSGTVLVNGDIIFNGAVNCSTARLGFVASGKIIFNTNSVDCGGYTALGGTISFSDASSGSAKGIFVARDNISLPNAALLTEPYYIKYDSLFASNPTALYKEILRVVLSTSS
jgi:hypothetical protein